MKIHFSCALIIAAGCAAGAASIAAPKTPAKPVAAKIKAPQKVLITLAPDYKNTPAATVKAGQPVALPFYLKSEAGCGDTVVLPAAKWKKTLKIGEKATVVYTATKTGALNFACSMNDMKGLLRVK